MRRRETTALLFCFLLSGATSLTLEVAWSKELSYVLGNTLYAVASVVAAFMLGLGLGSALAGQIGARIRRPLRAYAWVQIGVGVCAILSIPILRQMRPIFAAVYAASTPTADSFLLVRFLVVFSLMLVPAMLMGMTLPVVTGAMGRDKQRYDTEAGLAYGWNTLGAVLGTLAGGFLLIPAVGLLRTCIVAGSLDLAVAAVALLLDRKVGPITDIRSAQADEAVAGEKWNATQWSIAILFGVSGSVALALEVAWFRLLGLAMGPSVYAFAAMLGTYLTGIGLGSALGSRWMARSRVRGLPTMAALEAMLGTVGLLSLHYMNELPTASYNLLQTAIARLGESGLAVGQLGICAVVVLLPCLVMGLLFPVAVRALLEAGARVSPERTVGRLYLLNTAGGIAGSLVTGFWLVPHLGVWPTLLAAGFASGAIAAALLFLDRHIAATRRVAWAALALALTAVLAWLAPSWDVRRFNQGLYREGYKGQGLPEGRIEREKLIFYREGINAPVAVMSFAGGATLIVSGKPDASTHIEDLDTQLFLGHLPVLFTRNPQRAAVIGYGSGVTTHAFLTHAEVRSLDILEIESGVIDASPFFESVNHNPFDDARAQLILEDGRTYLTYSDKIYDCISSEPSNPWMAGVANLFTSDFYRIVRARLAEDGVFAQWIQDYEISEETYRVLLATLHDVFPYLVIFRPTGGDSIVLASGKPIVVPWETFHARFSAPPVQESFRRTAWKNPHQLLFLLQAPAASVEHFIDGTHLRNTDDNVWLERRMPFEMVGAGEATGHAGRAIVRHGSSHRVAAFTSMLPGIPLATALRESVRYPHTLEPVIGADAILSDPWHELRRILVDGLRQELAASEQRELSAQVVEWDREGETYRSARETASVKLRPLALQQAPASAATIDEALAAAPDLPLALLLAGQTLEGARNFDLAEHYYRQALEHPEGRLYDHVRLGLSRIALARGRNDDAMAIADSVVAQAPYFPSAYLWAAHLRVVNGAPDAARRLLEQALTLTPGDKSLADMQARLAAPQPSP